MMKSLTTKTAMAVAVLLASGSAMAGQDTAWKNSMMRLTNMALGCVEGQGAASCRGDIKDLRDVLIMKMSAVQAEGFIKRNVLDKPAVPAYR